mgnify:CR=1 FL=1
MFRYPFRLLTALIVFVTISCDQEENIIEFNGEDENAPKISVKGFTTEIEVATQISIEITDDSETVNNRLIVNGEKILENSDKNFKFDINPFDYPVGENKFVLYSVDEDGNETKFENTTIIKKFLASIASPHLMGNGRVFISANSMSGELLTNVEVFKDFENVKLYADDNFSEQPIIITSYILLGADNGVFSEIKSIFNIEPGTNLIEYQKNSGTFTENTYNPTSPTESFSIEVHEFEFENIANSLLGNYRNGWDSFAQIFTYDVVEEPNGFKSNLIGSVSMSANVEDLLLHTTNSTLDSSFDKIKLEDYRYLFVNTSNEQSISFSQFLPPDDIGYIYLPDNVERYSLSVTGFKNESAMNQQNYSTVFSESPRNFNKNTIEIPLINEFGLIISKISFPVNAYTSMEASVVGEKTIEIPDWSGQKNGELITLNGDFDLFHLLTVKRLPIENKTVRWEYFHKKENQVNLNIESFEFPEIIKSLASASFFELESIKTPDIESVTFIGSSGDLDYEQLLFGNNGLIPRPYNAGPVDIFTLRTALISSNGD